MLARGDLLFPVRFAAVVGPILTAVAVFGLWSWKCPLAPRAYWIGLSALTVAALLPFVPKFDSGYRQVYWLGETRYEIPWQYAPYNGSPDRGGKYFLINVSPPNLAPIYEYWGDIIMIGKAIDFNYGEGGAAHRQMCAGSYPRLSCQWQRGDFVYIVSGDADLFPADLSSFMDSAADLLDGFETSEP